MARRVGAALLTAGILLGCFVAYELWGTGFFARRAQAGLSAELEERAAAAAPQPVAYEPDLTLADSPIVLPADLPGPGEVDLVAALEAAGLPPASPPPEGDGVLLSEGLPPDGRAVGRIQIPAASVDWTVVEGVDTADLRRGAGHMPGTALPGQPGNSVISGHRTTYGAPFHNLDRVTPGDLLTVTTVTGTHVYQVVEARVVRPSEMWVTQQWSGSWLTLTTCHPRFSARERLVVFARLIGGPNAAALAEGPA